MNKIIVLITILIICTLHENHALVIFNECETCSYIDLNLNGYSYENESVYLLGHLGGYGTALTWVVPAGEYSLTGLCDSGESKGFVWIEFPVLTGALLIDQLALYCPEITTTSTSSSTTTAPLQICPFQEIYGEYSQEVEYLRYIRDKVLRQTTEGRELIKLYYQWSPAIVMAMEEDELFKEELREIMDGVLSMIAGEVK
jgi:hypothetical protein